PGAAKAGRAQVPPVRRGGLRRAWSRHQGGPRGRPRARPVGRIGVPRDGRRGGARLGAAGGGQGGGQGGGGPGGGRPGCAGREGRGWPAARRRRSGPVMASRSWAARPAGSAPNRAAAPKTSRSTGRSLATTGTPAASASIAASPKPSLVDGNANAAAEATSDGRLS